MLTNFFYVSYSEKYQLFILNCSLFFVPIGQLNVLLAMMLKRLLFDVREFHAVAFFLVFAFEQHTDNEGNNAE